MMHNRIPWGIITIWNYRIDAHSFDNGTGIPEEIDFKSSKTLGLQLVNILVDQPDGKIELERAHGTEFIISFSVEEKKRINKKENQHHEVRFPETYDLSFIKTSVPCLRNSLIFSWYTTAAGTSSNGTVAAALAPSETGSAAKKLAPVTP